MTPTPKFHVGLIGDRHGGPERQSESFTCFLMVTWSLSLFVVELFFRYFELNDSTREQILSKDEDDDKSIQSSHVNGVSRSCTDCHTTRTPLWRGGPAGPKVSFFSLQFCLHMLIWAL